MFDSLIHLQDSQTLSLQHPAPSQFDSLIHLQDSQTRSAQTLFNEEMFDSLIHLQDSQTCRRGMASVSGSLIHLFTYKTLKLFLPCLTSSLQSLIHLFTYKTLKRGREYPANNRSLIHLFTYKTLKPRLDWEYNGGRLIHLFTYKTLKLNAVAQTMGAEFDSLIHLQDSQTKEDCNYQ